VKLQEFDTYIKEKILQKVDSEDVKQARRIET